MKASAKTNAVCSVHETLSRTKAGQAKPAGLSTCRAYRPVMPTRKSRHIADFRGVMIAHALVVTDSTTSGGWIG